jgi:hypothetical protein
METEENLKKNYRTNDAQIKTKNKEKNKRGKK